MNCTAGFDAYAEYCMYDGRKMVLRMKNGEQLEGFAQISVHGGYVMVIEGSRFNACPMDVHIEAIWYGKTWREVDAFTFEYMEWEHLVGRYCRECEKLDRLRGC